MRPSYDHLFLNDHFVRTQKYTTPRSGIRKYNIPDRDRISHAETLRRKFNEIWENDARYKIERKAVSLPNRDGTYLEFIGKPGYELLTERLESRTKKIVLLNVKQVEREEGNLE